MTKTSKASPDGFGFICAALRRDPKTPYADIAAKAKEKGLTIFPIQYGKAKVTLGLIKAAKYGTGKHAQKTAQANGKAEAAAPTPTRHKAATTTPRRPRAVSANGQDSTAQAFSALQDRLRRGATAEATLGRVREMVAEALGA